MASKCTKCGNTENYNFALNIGLCDPCIGERIAELEADICPSWMGKEKGCNEAQDAVELEERIEKLEAALQGMVPFIEDDFPNGTGTNHGTCATDQYQQACDAIIQAINS